MTAASMELHGLAIDELNAPRLAPDDPTAVVWLGRDGRVDVIAKRTGDWCWFRIADLATYRFPAESPDLTVSCVAQADAGKPLAAVVDGYYRTVVPLALQVYGLEAMHGTAVETAAGAVALCGSSHAGKTTLTYALSRRGHRLLADDGLVIDASAADGVFLQPIPFALMIREPTAAYFGTPVREHVRVAEDLAPSVAVAPVPLAAVVLLNRVKSGEQHLQALEKPEAYISLLAHCYTFSLDDVGRKARMLRAYARFADTVPVYRLTYPDGLDRLDSAAAAVEEVVLPGSAQAVSTKP